MSIQVAGIQSDTVWEDREANLRRLRPKIAAAAAGGADLVVLPEMFAVGFTMNTEAVREPVDGPSSQFLRDVAADEGCWVAGSIPEVADGNERPYNSFVLAGPAGQLHRYAKIHPFTYADEHHHYAAGSDFVTVTVGDVRCTLFVCYDLRFADEFWATATDTDLYLVCANWPAPRREHWTALLRARAVENQAYVIGVNRVGEGNGLDYTGDSMIIDPLGQVLVAGSRVETTITASVDPGRVQEVRSSLPFLQDRR